MNMGDAAVLRTIAAAKATFASKILYLLVELRG
jgi:hypothetical protein